LPSKLENLTSLTRKLSWTVSYTHDLEKLVKVAQLYPTLETARRSDPVFANNWLVVKDWSEESRYQKYNKQEAIAIYLAITEPNQGVLQWVQQHW
jgi:hypothetical protein